MQSNQCNTCAHYYVGGACAAFPDGIPQEIITGEHDHREPYNNDKGLRWEPIDPTIKETDVFND